MKKRLIIFSPSHNTDLSQFYENDECYKEESQKRGYNCIIIGNKNTIYKNDGLLKENIKKGCFLPFFKYKLFKKFKFRIFFRNFLKRIFIEDQINYYEIVITNYKFYLELSKIKKKIKIKISDKIIIHTIETSHILGIIWWYKKYFNKFGSVPELKIIFKLPIFAFNINALKACSEFIKNNNIFNGKLEIYGDNLSLSKDFSEFFGKVKTLPMIHGNRNLDYLKHKKNIRTNFKNSKNKMRFSFLGHTRFEKGVMEVFSSIISLSKTPIFKKIEFHIQLNSLNDLDEKDIDYIRIKKGIKSLKNMNFKNIFLYFEPLSYKEYRNILLESEVVIMPYFQEQYQSRTSGVFCDACSMGKVIIATEKTCMEYMKNEIDKTKNCGIIFSKDRDINDISNKIEYCYNNYEYLKSKSEDFRKKWIKYHNIKNIMNILKI
jgi:hypothetical protein